MNYDDIINNAFSDLKLWENRGFNNGKFVLGIEAKQILMASFETIKNNNPDPHNETLFGYPYVVDFNDPHCVHFAPIIEGK